MSKFDFRGKPHILHDDHLQLLRRSDCFVARKIWPHANRLYEAFLPGDREMRKSAEPNPARIDRIFSKAVERRTHGRHGLYMQSRFPAGDTGFAITAAPYSVFQGFAELFENFQPWLTRTTGARVHGYLFDRHRVEFSDNLRMIAGALDDSVASRDSNPDAFLASLVWNTRGERQCFQFGPGRNQDVVWRMARDPDAQISIIAGAWALPLFRSNREFGDIRQEAAALQKTESACLDVLRSRWTKAHVRIWTLAEFIEAPMQPLQAILDKIRPDKSHHLAKVPRMMDMTGSGPTSRTSWPLTTSPGGSRPSAALRPTNTSAKSGHQSRIDSSWTRSTRFRD